MPFSLKAAEASNYSMPHDLAYDQALDLARQFATNGKTTVYIVRDPEGGEAVGLHLSDFPAGWHIAAVVTASAVLAGFSQPFDSLAGAAVNAAERRATEDRPIAIVNWVKERGIWRTCPFDRMALSYVRPAVNWAVPTA